MATLQQRPAAAAIFDQDDDSQYHHVSSVPPSPTLSNPDMILPDEGERQSQTPSPPFNLPSLSHLQAFYSGGAVPPAQGEYASGGGYPANSRGKKMTENAADASSMTGPIGVAYSLSNSSSSGNTGSTSRASSSKNLLPRHNTSVHRLSDIGEEEGPSPPPKRASSQLGRFPVNAPPAGQDWRALAASQARTVENGVSGQNKDPGSRSSSSNSTLSGNANGDSSQQQQQQQQQTQQTPQKQQEPEVQGTKRNTLNMGVNDVPVNNAGGRDEVASAVLSNEAERILDNAKKRLTLMEGNLTRARSSMRNYSPSMSPSPLLGYQSMGLGQPVGGLYRSVSSMDRQASAALRPRPMYSTYQDAAGNRHSRVLSENYLPSSSTGPNVPSTSLEVEPPSSLSRGLSRSVSALGSTSASSLQRDERSFRYDPNRAYLTHHASTPSLANGSMPPRSKTSSPPELGSPGLDIVNEEPPKAKISNIDDFNSVYPAEFPSRTQSQMQMHDLQDQMKGLHIKISSLKVKTQEDGIRRRSLQSLRTPSPLTAADPWYVNAMEYRDKRGHLSPNPSGLRMSFESARETQNENGTSARNSGSFRNSGESRRSANADFHKKTGLDPAISEQQPDDVAESLYEDAGEGDEIDRDELDEILREPLDDDLEGMDERFHMASQDATPHEEREDAFDYEHFILHSALGNYSRSKLRRANSNVSNASVETTRPARARSTRSSRSLRSSARHSRTNSVTSLSTAATFATAAEGENDFNGVLYWDRKFNDELRGEQFSPNEEDLAHDENIDFETPTGTPRAPRRTGANNVDDDDDNDPASTSPLEPPFRSESVNNGSATPTALASSLVSTVRAASGSPYPHQEQQNSGINNDDERLLELLFQSLGNVCMDLQTITTSAEPDEKDAKILRRRLDAARRVLDGELDA